MSSDHDWWLLMPEPIRRLPADLTAVIVLTLLTVLVVSVPAVQETPLRIILGLPLVLFLPGYAFVAALFPEQGTQSRGDERSMSRDQGIDPIERIALAFGVSIAIVPLIGLVLNFTPWGIQLIPVVLSISIFITGCTVIAAIRRWELPPDKRFSVPYREWLTAGRAEVCKPNDRIDIALNIMLALSILLALGSIGFVVAFPQEGEQFTEFYLLSEDDNGELVANDYREEFIQGEPQSLIIGIENNEHETVEYTVVVQLERVEDEDTETEVVEREELDRFGTTLAHNETWHEERSITPTMAGEELRLTFLLYNDEVPSEPTRENSYRDLHIWINVE